MIGPMNFVDIVEDHSAEIKVSVVQNYVDRQVLPTNKEGATKSSQLCKCMKV